MFDDYDDPLQKDEHYFGRSTLDGEGNKIIEVYGSDVDGERRFREELITEAKIGTWLDKYDSTTSRTLLRVFVCAPEQHKSDAEVIALPFSCATLQAIRQKWSLLRTTSGGIMLRGGRSKDRDYCVATTKCATAGIVNCFVHGLQANEIVDMKRCLRESKFFAHHAMLLPLILVEWKIHHFAVLLERRTRYLASVEKDTGLIHGAADDPDANISPQERIKRLEEIDFGRITQKLTGLLGTLYFCGLTFQGGLDSLELIEEVSKGSQELPNCFVRRITYLKGLIAGAEDSKRLLEARAQAQADTVNSLISQ
ncbi:hypothetical protein P171DRAFT_483785 [Karstenula rhodostoma CBS 690.94]|uniref:Uncharacterized protein n=1 Tax=Karstenula rhodostoma CBS 690.94 TaxID=1392251 RepID=A0A9P4PP45_9PLEO|nr:hypothetical protein P171DRAFT_483785 [Karstenula rhodostoma CBS 690.94]